MYKLMTAMTVVLSVSLGGCHVFKSQSGTHAVAVTETAKPKVTVEELDIRVTDIERRMAAARAARAKADAAKKSFISKL